MLRDDIRDIVRVRSTKTDAEIDAYIAAAKAKMRSLGIREELLVDPMNDETKFAVIAFCKANYGPDTDPTKWFEMFQWALTSLMNSSANETLYEEPSDG